MPYREPEQSKEKKREKKTQTILLSLYDSNYQNAIEWVKCCKG